MHGMNIMKKNVLEFAEEKFSFPANQGMSSLTTA
jgi:hypothetical protein